MEKKEITKSNPHEQTLVMNNTEDYKMNQKLNDLLWEYKFLASEKGSNE